MKLTQKDKEFLETLRSLMDEKDLRIELVNEDGCSRFKLKQNYGDKIEKSFHMSRQGVRWRFQRLFNDIYTQAYTTICVIESNFGTELRSKAMTIAKETIQLHRKKRSHFCDQYPYTK